MYSLMLYIYEAFVPLADTINNKTILKPEFGWLRHFLCMFIRYYRLKEEESEEENYDLLYERYFSIYEKEMYLDYYLFVVNTIWFGEWDSFPRFNIYSICDIFIYKKNLRLNICVGY